MPRRSLQYAGPLVWHVMNRAIQGLTLFHQPTDYDAFLGILASSVRDHTIELFAYCVMPNHFHLVVRAAVGFELSAFMATSRRVGTRASVETSAVAIVMPAEGPSLGMAPSGT